MIKNQIFMNSIDTPSASPSHDKNENEKKILILLKTPYLYEIGDSKNNRRFFL